MKRKEDKTRQSVVIIPAYEPSVRLTEIAQRISDEGYRLIVVDDGSGSEFDRIWDALSRITRVRILHQNINRGKGAALKAAFRYIQRYGSGIEHIVTMDADGQHLVSDMENVLGASWDAPECLVLGSRTFGRNVPLKSKLGNRITRVVFTAACRTRVRDTQTGLRAFGRDMMDRMAEIPGERYEYEMNALIGAAKTGTEIIEVPIETVYLDSTNSCSHFDPFRDAVRIYGNIIKFTGASFISFIADYLLFTVFYAGLSGVAYRLLASNIAARCISAMLNYTLNSRVVFHDDRPVRRTLPGYLALAAFILAVNNAVLAFFVDIAGIYPQAAKILTEALLFAISYMVQSMLIFRKGGKKEIHADEKEKE